MKNFFRQRFSTLYAYQRATRALLLDKTSYLHSSGYIRSAARLRPCDARGEPIPWMNYSIIHLLEERLATDMKVFEFGSGSSTLFLAERVAAITSCEHDAAWYEECKASAPHNVTLLLRKDITGGEYSSTAHEQADEFDIIIVDGEDRVNCVKQSVGKLNHRGVLLLDDSEREEYHESFDCLQQHGFRHLTIEGLKALQRPPSCTTIFYRDGNCLGI